MKTVSISGSLRANVGKKDAKAIRAQGNVPCVLYGGKEQIAFHAPSLAFTKLVYTPDVQIAKLDIDGKSYDAILQDIQFDIVTDRIAHIDFLQILPGKAVTMNIPVTTKGSAAGVKEGGKLQKKTRTLKLRGPVEKIPASIELDVTNLNIGDSIRVSDIKFDGVTLLDPPNFTVVGVRVTRQVVEEVAAPIATTAAPAAGATTAAPAAEGAKKEEKKEEKKK